MSKFEWYCSSILSFVSKFFKDLKFASYGLVTGIDTITAHTINHEKLIPIQRNFNILKSC